MDFNGEQGYISANNDQVPEELDKFSVASMILGILSILLCCTGVLSIPAGALGILFAVLSRRLGKEMPALSVSGIVLSCIGMLMGAILFAYTVYLILYDPAYRELYNQMYEQLSSGYGVSGL